MTSTAEARPSRAAFLWLCLCTALAVSVPEAGRLGEARAQSQDDLFDRMAGSWTGAGAARLSDGSQERIRCRAEYRHSSRNGLDLALRCASDSFNLQASGRVTRAGNQLTGSWSEATLGMSGNLSGQIAGDSINAQIDGGGFSARIRFTLRGQSQSVSLASDLQSATMVLHRN